MHFRLALFAVVALAVPDQATAQCASPMYATNTVCFDPHGGMKIAEYVGLPNGRYRIFSMNGRTNDKAKANVFWMIADNGSVGNFVNPRFTMIDYIEHGEKVTLLNIKIDVTYGTQRDVLAPCRVGNALDPMRRFQISIVE